MRIGSKGLKLIKDFEGLHLQAYICPAGVPTIGYGHTRTVSLSDVNSRLTIAEYTADELLKQDVRFAEIAVYSQLQTLNQNQFDALVSFTFNVGATAFKGSTLLRKIKSGAPEEEIRYEFSRWNKIGGKSSNGLTRRRQAEANLYFEK